MLSPIFQRELIFTSKGRKSALTKKAMQGPLWKREWKKKNAELYL